MKAAIFILMLCAFACPGHAADEPEFSKSKVEALIASLPTQVECDQVWHAIDANEVKKLDPGILAKWEGETARCKELFSLIKPGKSILDYPGILVLGHVSWDAGLKTYKLTVTAASRSSTVFAGFDCVFSESGTIMRKEVHICAGK